MRIKDEKHPNAASAGVDATSVGNSVAAAAVQSIEAVAATAAKQRKRKIDEISSMAHSTASKIKRIASESGLAHRVISTVSPGKENHLSLMRGLRCRVLPQVGRSIVVEISGG